MGIPTVMDRIIQQAMHQELVPVFDSIFSQYSYGFRPNRSAGQAVLQAQKYIQEGYEWVVDIDLEKFFDKVNHDMLMARVSRRVKDKVRGLTKKFSHIVSFFYYPNKIFVNISFVFIQECS